MAVRPLTALFHVTALAIMLYGWFKLGGVGLHEYVRTQKGGHFQFLTIQGLWLAFATISLSLLADLFPSFNREWVIYAKRRLLMIALPLAVVISLIYWTLVTLAPSLILPPSSSRSTPSSSSKSRLFHIPLTIDLALHASPAVVLFLDFNLLEQRYSRREVLWDAPKSAIVFGLWYTGWVEYCATFNKKFPYPFLNTTFPNRVIIYCSTSILALASFSLINALHPARPLLYKGKEETKEKS